MGTLDELKNESNMSVRILGSSDLYFEGEGRYRYYGNDPEYINTKSIRRIKTTLEFKKQHLISSNNFKITYLFFQFNSGKYIFPC